MVTAIRQPNCFNATLLFSEFSVKGVDSVLPFNILCFLKKERKKKPTFCFAQKVHDCYLVAFIKIRSRVLNLPQRGQQSYRQQKETHWRGRYHSRLSRLKLKVLIKKCDSER